MNVHMLSEPWNTVLTLVFFRNYDDVMQVLEKMSRDSLQVQMHRTQQFR
jgi:hypothetical protein